MGFRCPVCKKDFGTDKEAWKEHITTEHDGLGDDCVNILANICEER